MVRWWCENGFYESLWAAPFCSGGHSPRAVADAFARLCTHMGHDIRTRPCIPEGFGFGEWFSGLVPHLCGRIRDADVGRTEGDTRRTFLLAFLPPTPLFPIQYRELDALRSREFVRGQSICV